MVKWCELLPVECRCEYNVTTGCRIKQKEIDRLNKEINKEKEIKEKWK